MSYSLTDDLPFDLDTPEETNGIMFSMTAHVFENLLKILNSLKKCEFILIKNSKIEQEVNNYIIKADLSSVIGNGIDLEILAPYQKLDLLKKLIPNKKNITDDFIIEFINDKANQRFIVTNKTYKIYLPKSDIEEVDVKQFNNNNVEMIGKPSRITSDLRKDIISFHKNKADKADITNKYQLLFKSNELLAVNIIDTADILLTSKDIDESKADFRLLSSSFLEVEGSDYMIIPFKNNNEYWLRTIVATEIKINDKPFTFDVFEKLNEDFENDLL